MIKGSKRFYEAFINSMPHMADACTDAVIGEYHKGNPAAPFILMEKIMETEEKIREMAKRGLIPADVEKKAIERFEEYLEDGGYMEWAVDFMENPPEE